jgi:hypothetical protein
MLSNALNEHNKRTRCGPRQRSEGVHLGVKDVPRHTPKHAFFETEIALDFFPG